MKKIFRKILGLFLGLFGYKIQDELGKLVSVGGNPPHTHYRIVSRIVRKKKKRSKLKHGILEKGKSNDYTNNNF